MIDKEFAKKVRYIQIYTSKAVNDVLAGEYHSVFKGSGIEFNEVREYQPGDEIRSIDWNVTARAGHPYVKRYIEERDLRVMFLVDLSASGSFGSHNRTKNEIAAEICALLAFSAVKNNDRVGLMAFTDALELNIPPKKGAAHALRLIREVLAFQPKGKGTDIRNALDDLARFTHKRCVVFLISDFLDTGYERSLRIVARKHDLIAISLSDPHEESLPRAGLIELADAETGQTQLVDTSSTAVRTSFAAKARARIAALGEQFRSMKIDHIHLSTQGDYLRSLVRFFRARERRKKSSVA